MLRVERGWRTSGHRTGLDKFKRLEIMQEMFFDHNRTKLQVNEKTGTRKIHKYMEIEQHP